MCVQRACSLPGADEIDALDFVPLRCAATARIRETLLRQKMSIISCMRGSLRVQDTRVQYSPI